MPTTTSITTTYAGEYAKKYIAAALLSAPTLDKGLITVKPNIKYKEVVKKGVVSDLIANASCDFTPTGTINITERYLMPEEFQVNLQLCKKDFRSDWEAIEMGISVYDNLPPTFQDFLLAQVIAKVAEENEQHVWHGVNANAGEYDGLIVLATADADVLDVAAPAAGGISASNVIAELGKFADTVPSKIWEKPDFGMYVSPNVARAYRRAMGALGYLREYYVADVPMEFEGKPLLVCDGLNASYMVGAQKDNLWFGTGLLDEKNEVKLIDMADIDGSQNVRVIMRFTAAVQYGIGSEIVLYTPGA